MDTVKGVSQDIAKALLPLSEMQLKMLQSSESVYKILGIGISSNISAIKIDLPIVSELYSSMAETAKIYKNTSRYLEEIESNIEKDYVVGCPPPLSFESPFPKLVENSSKALEKQDEIIHLLHNIDKNTIGISQVVNLLKNNSDKTDVLIKVFEEIITISETKSEEDAKTRWEKLRDWLLPQVDTATMSIFTQIVATILLGLSHIK